jgi:hypothetical protein
MSHACPIWAFWETRASPNLLKKKVGAPGFEPGTFGSQNRLEVVRSQTLSAGCFAHPRRMQHNPAWECNLGATASTVPRG